MSNLITALAVPVDGFVTRRDSSLHELEALPATGVTHPRHRVVK